MIIFYISFDAAKIIGIGVDTTGSTPIPVDAEGLTLAMKTEFKDNLNANVWLWKDHTSYAEAAEITELAKKEHPEYLAKCGGTCSSEWFFRKKTLFQKTWQKCLLWTRIKKRVIFQ